MDSKELINYLRAGFSAIWLKTPEPNRVRKNIYKDLHEFVRKDGKTYKVIEWTNTKNANPATAIQELMEAESHTILFAYNWHWYSDKPQNVQLLQDNLPIWSNSSKAFVAVSPLNKIPVELNKDFVLLDMPLPDESEITDAIEKMARNENQIPAGKDLTRLVSSCKGLTTAELDSVLALSLVSNGGTFDTQVINKHKAMTIQKTGFLDILSPTVTFSDIIGYNNIKNFVMETIDNPKAKGVMTIGPPGCGKTSLMKAIVGETGKFGLSVNMGSLFSKYQGETDQNINATIQLITAIGDCFVLIDEFEKQFAGASSDGSLDSGTTRRATGRWLEFLQDRPKGVYICGTANSFQGIPGEYLRPGRWDSSPFFIDLPNAKTKRKILEYYIKKAGMKDPGIKMYPKMDQFSGAEIEALVHIADMRNMTLRKAVTCVIPQAKTKAEDITTLREWAKGRTIPAEEVPPMGKEDNKRSIDI